MASDQARFAVEDHLGALYRKHVLEKGDTAAAYDRFKRHMAMDDTVRQAAVERRDHILALVASGMDESTLHQRCYISAMHLKFLRQALAA